LASNYIILIKTAGIDIKNRHQPKQWNKQSKKENTHRFIVFFFIFDKKYQEKTMGKVSLIKLVGKLHIHREKNKIGPYLTPYTKIHSKWI
jgi:hypothetical protein